MEVVCHFATLRAERFPTLHLKSASVAFLRVQKSVEALEFDDEVQQAGAEIVRRALEEPLRMIAQNAGFEGSVVVEKIRVEKNVNFGFNAETEEYEDLFTSGVIDPVKVTRTTLQNAASIAGLLLRGIRARSASEKRAIGHRPAWVRLMRPQRASRPCTQQLRHL